MRRKSVKIILALVGVLLVLVALAPTLASGFVRGRIAQALSERIDGRVSVGAVSLGWFSPQRIEQIEVRAVGAADAVAMSLEVREGLWSLLAGDQVTVALGGSVDTALAPDGSVGLARMVRPAEAVRAVQGGEGGAAPVAAGALLGGRSVRVEIQDVDATLAMPDGRRLSLRDLRGVVGLREEPSREPGREPGQEPGQVPDLRAAIELDAATRVERAASDGRAGQEAMDGTIRVEADVAMPRRTDGAFDLAGMVAEAQVDAAQVPLPSTAGEIVLDRLALVFDLEARGACTLDAKGTARVAGAAATTLDASVRTADIFAADGSVSVEPADITARVDLRALPVAALQVLAPEVGGSRIDLVAELGPTADLVVRKDGSGAGSTSAAKPGEAAGRGADLGVASLEFESQRLRVRFQGRVSDDGGAVESGTLAASAALRPELVQALAGVAVAESLAFTVEGESIVWQRARADEASVLEALGGSFELALARPLVLKSVLPAQDGRAALDATVAEWSARVTKPLGSAVLLARSAGTGSLGARGAFGYSAEGELDAMQGAVRKATLDASLALDPAVVERFGSGVVAARGRESTLRVKVSELEVAGSGGGSTGVVGASLAERLALRGRVEVGGALEVNAGEGKFALSGTALDLAFAPRMPVSVGLGARIDGATIALSQQLPRLPARFDGLGAGSAGAVSSFARLGASGSLEIRGLDAALVGRLVPDAKPALDALGSGAIDLTLRNAPVAASGLDAVRVDFALDAPALDARGVAQLGDDAIALTGLEVAGTLRAESLAMLPTSAGIQVEPGASFTARVASFALARGNSGWSPTGDLAAELAMPRIRVRSAPGIVQPLPDLGLALKAGYAFAREKATVSGEVRLGADARDGRIELDLAWQKPAEAKLFQGVEGSVALTGFDPVRVEQSLDPELGLSSGMLAELLGGRGALRVTLEERTTPRAQAALDFPNLRASLALGLAEVGNTRRASVEGSASATLAPEIFARFAGLAGDPTRRVKSPVTAGIQRLRIDLPVPASSDGTLQPSIADAAVEVDAALSDVVLEIRAPRPAPGAQGGASQAAPPATVASGALRVGVRSARLAESVRVQVDSGTPGAAAGTLQADLTIRGAFPTGDQPSRLEVDGTLRANRYASATVDALAATDGAIQRYIGDVIDAEITATAFDLSALRASADPDPEPESPVAAPKPGQGRGNAGRAAGGNPPSVPGRTNAGKGGSASAATPASDNGADEPRAEAGRLSIRLRSDYAELVAPAVYSQDGMVRIRKTDPLRASLSMSPAVRDELLRAIHVVFSDVVTDQKARFTVQNLAYPLDGDLRRMNGAFRLELGDVRLSNQSWLSKLLTLAQAQRADGLEARIEPLEARIVRGRLTYSDFAMRVGKTRDGGWKNSLVFTGDVDLGAKPVRVNALTTAVPLSDAGRWSSDVRSLFDRLAAISPELVKRLTVGFKLSGPIRDAKGNPVDLEVSVAAPDIDDVIRKDPSLLLQLGPALIEEFRRLGR